MNSEQLAKWLLKEGIDEKDVKILKGTITHSYLQFVLLIIFAIIIERGINERQFMKLHEKSEKLKDISDSTIDDLEDLQKDLSERHQRTNQKLKISLTIIFDNVHANGAFFLLLCLELFQNFLLLCYYHAYATGVYTPL